MSQHSQFLPRLSAATLSALAPEVTRPAYDRSKLINGVVHFGPGAFHRAHQAHYIDHLLARDPRWGITGISLRSAAVRDALAPQDGLYILSEIAAERRYRVIGALLEILVAPEQPEAMMRRLSDPATMLVTLTVTEKGYCLAGDALDEDHPEIRRDLETPGPPQSLIGVLCAGLAERRALGRPPFVTMSCDNLADNGHRLKAALTRFAALCDPDLAGWIADHAVCPCTMVDSITPATDAAFRAEAARAAGVEDYWPVQREAFTQFVIERHDAAAVPDWAAAGAILTSEVKSFEQAKLRLLNGAHSALAYLGALRGLETVRQAMDDPSLASFIERMMREEIAPTLALPGSFDAGAYIGDILARFRNPGMAHRLAQIAWDGSQKLPIRILGTIADRLRAGRPAGRLALPIAGWMLFVIRRAKAGSDIIDPLAARLSALGLSCNGEALHDVDQFLTLDTIFPRDLAARPEFRQALITAYEAAETGDFA